MRIELKAGRVIVTLARHERTKTASEIISKINRSRTAIQLTAGSNGATVQIEQNSATPKHLYLIRPEQF